jgi:predicted GNAT family acetyltransferase
VTALRPGLRRQGAAAVLDDSARAGLQRLLDADPIVNAVVAARVRAAGSLSPGLLGGPMIGVREGADLTAACFSGGNLLTIGGDPDAWPALAEFVSARPRSCSSIVGRAEAIAAMWPILQRRWGRARAVRAAQPLLVLDGPVLLPGDGEVRPAQLHHLDRYLPAAAAMFAEELGVSPHVAPGAASFEARVRDLIADGRAFASFDFRGQVVFKAEIGAVSEHTSQIQGVWVRPDLRGRGIGTAALATVFRHALTLAPTVSLYVNDFNEPARRVYQRLGMQHIATLSTVLLP